MEWHLEGNGSSLLNTAPGMVAVGEFPKHLCVRAVAVPCTLQLLCKGLGSAKCDFDQVPAGVRSVRRVWGPWMLGCCGSGAGASAPKGQGWGWQAHESGMEQWSISQVTLLPLDSSDTVFLL